MSERFSCARASLARDEPLYATASTVARWIVIEQPGPWGRDALLESRLPDVAGEELQARARDLRARVILMRRHRGRDADPDVRRIYVAHTGPPNTWIESFELDRPGDLLDLDLSDLSVGRRVGGDRVDHPVYLTCTNGSHDVCCAEFGRPVAAAMDAARPDHAWECSHIGGDRFAGNVLILPEGLYYGRVGPDDAAQLAELHEGGRLDLERFRGRSCYPFLLQAAEHFLRAQYGYDGIDDVVPVARRKVDDGVHRVDFRMPRSTRLSVTVTVRPDPEGHLLTCHADGPACPPRYEVRAIEAVDPA
ncbi:MAG: sucrase ferredoxin [Actinobacteria bacterium]|nr:sucrase ferredoxin [Actinomycetota bacterium]